MQPPYKPLHSYQHKISSDGHTCIFGSFNKPAYLSLQRICIFWYLCLSCITVPPKDILILLLSPINPCDCPSDGHAYVLLIPPMNPRDCPSDRHAYILLVPLTNPCNYLSNEYTYILLVYPMSLYNRRPQSMDFY